MNGEATITILGKTIPFRHESMPIDKLRYFEFNPRVHSSVHGQELPEDKEDLQDLIHKQMLEETSVKNVIPEIIKQDGLLDPIFVRYDTMEVIEGNSRLAAYRSLNEKSPNEKWATIPCMVVSTLTNRQQSAYLNQIHVKGKTPWLAYEKANQAYIMKNTEGDNEEEIAKTLSESVNEIRKRIRTIVLMEENGDKERSHFSYYDVLVRTRKIADEIEHNPQLGNILLSQIKNLGQDGTAGTDFKAQELRDKLPPILNKKKELKKFMDGRLTLDEAYQNARLSGPHQNVIVALEKIYDLQKNEIASLSRQEINAMLITVNKLNRAVNRVKLMVEEAKELVD